MVTVYSKDACVQCKATKRRLEQKGIPFKEVRIDLDDKARDYVLSLGYFQAPVVVVDEYSHWSGFSPESIDALAQR